MQLVYLILILFLLVLSIYLFLTMPRFTKRQAANQFINQFNGHYVHLDMKSPLPEFLEQASPLLIEIDAEAERFEFLEKITFQLDQYQGSFAIMSADPMILSWFKTHRSNFIRIQKANSEKILLLHFLSRPDLIVSKTNPTVIFHQKLLKTPVIKAIE